MKHFVYLLPRWNRTSTLDNLFTIESYLQGLSDAGVELKMHPEYKVFYRSDLPYKHMKQGSWSVETSYDYYRLTLEFPDDTDPAIEKITHTLKEMFTAIEEPTEMIKERPLVLQ